jgi:hypothetical protein
MFYIQTKQTNKSNGARKIYKKEFGKLSVYRNKQKAYQTKLRNPEDWSNQVQVTE